MWHTDQVLTALLANPEVWASTVLFIMDENDGWFDHVSPPTAPAVTAGEYVSVSPLPADAGGSPDP
jgi:phospholipase C